MYTIIYVAWLSKTRLRITLLLSKRFTVIIPVSYTHLDVYKRQSSSSSSSGFWVVLVVVLQKSEIDHLRVVM